MSYLKLLRCNIFYTNYSIFTKLQAKVVWSHQTPAAINYCWYCCPILLSELSDCCFCAVPCCCCAAAVMLQLYCYCCAAAVLLLLLLCCCCAVLHCAAVAVVLCCTAAVLLLCCCCYNLKNRIQSP